MVCINMLDYDGNHECDFYVNVLFYLWLLGDCISVGIYLLFLRFSRKPNEYFGVIKLI